MCVAAFVGGACGTATCDADEMDLCDANKTTSTNVCDADEMDLCSDGSTTTTTTGAPVTYKGTMEVKSAASQTELERAVKSTLAVKLKVAESKITVKATKLARRLDFEDSAEVARRLGGTHTASTWNVAFTIITTTASTAALDKDIKAFKADTKGLTDEIKAQLTKLGVDKDKITATTVSKFSAAAEQTENLTSDSYSLAGKWPVALAFLMSTFSCPQTTPFSIVAAMLCLPRVCRKE